ncbi:hypothetical protein [Peribacillus alkalitolerans]|uniref:hypothetical protein n=1 Tax=Peribacillus alkalitolerans TaxID=1550385 RepID=UPI0013D4E9A9|nr:hypothetical protein [Peribacillus alkalitolerans]
MKKWIISAALYLLVVIVGYTVYAEFIREEKGVEHEGNEHETASEEHGEEAGHEEESEHAHQEEGSHESHESEVDPTLNYENGKINISLQDKNGKPVTELEVNHEKLLHLIIVNSHLDQYYHVHPQDLGEGKFEVTQALPDGEYKAFVDIKPKDLEYTVNPLPFTVGNVEGSHEHGDVLKADDTLTKTVEGETVTLKMNTMKANEPVTLDFELNMENLEPYLGAMGHVVIIDEQANQYLHVHPADHDKPIFQTEFSQPGKYKIWGEFQQDGKVRVFPFVVEITE